MFPSFILRHLSPPSRQSLQTKLFHTLHLSSQTFFHLRLPLPLTLPHPLRSSKSAKINQTVQVAPRRDPAPKAPVIVVEPAQARAPDARRGLLRPRRFVKHGLERHSSSGSRAPPWGCPRRGRGRVRRSTVRAGCVTRQRYRCSQARKDGAEGAVV